MRISSLAAPLAAIVALALAPCSPAVAQTAAARTAAARTAIGADQDLLTVVFEFDVEPAQQQELSEKIQPLVRDIVSRQPGFVSAHLHLSADGTKVLNYFQWESHAAFDAFRQNEALQQQIRPVIGPYGPTPRVYTIEYSAVAGGQAVAQTAAPPRAAVGEDVTVVLYPVAAGDRAAFEAFIEDVFWPAADRLSGTDAQVFRQTRVLYPRGPQPDGTYAYGYLMDPYIDGGDYGIESLLKKAYGEEEGAEHFRTYESLVGDYWYYEMTQSEN